MFTIHCTNPPVPMGELLALLRPGDIVSHFLHGRGHGILDEKGQVRREVPAARERGVLFDVSHGRMHVKFLIARTAIAQGFYPDTISSDLTMGGSARSSPALSPTSPCSSSRRGVSISRTPTAST